MKKIISTLLFSLGLVTISFGQFSEDALRYAGRGLGAGSRALGMGNAYFGVSDDYTASVWNPAGLAQMRRLEITGGFSNFGYSNDASYLSKQQNAATSATSIDNIGFVFPFPTVQGSLVFAFGYNRIADFASAVKFEGFNSQSSIIPTLYDSDADYDIPFNTYLTNTTGYTAIQGNVNQYGEIKEGGSLGLWSFAGAIDVEENVSVGISLNVYSGMYDYTRNILEEDSKNVYANTSANLPADSAYLRFNKFYYDSYLSSEVDGSNITLGIMYRSDIFRVGAIMKGPTTISVRETYSNEGESVFDNTGSWSTGNPAKKYSTPISKNEYGVSSPWSFGLGASLYILPELLIAADIEHTDWTQIEWTDSPTLEKTNPQLQSKFRPTTSYRVGGEFDVPSTDLRLRAGYSLTPSPYKNDPSSFDQTMITGGIGYFLQRNIVLDGTVAVGSFKSFRNQYITPTLTTFNASRTDESISTTLVNFTLSYRF